MMAALAAIRAIHFASLMLVWGGCGFLVLLKSQLGVGLPAPLTQKAVTGATLLGFVTAMLWLALVAGQMSGDWRLAGDPATVWTVTTGTRFGAIAVARIAGLALMGLLIPWRRAGNGVFALLGALVLGSLGLTSHAAASNGPFGLALALNDALHLLAAGFWLGGLVVLAMLVRFHRGNTALLAASLRLFSAWGVLAVCVLVLTGIINGASILPLRAIAGGSAYADILAVKVALALCMIGLAAVNRSQLLPSLDNRETGAVGQLKRNIAAEILLGGLVVAIVGYLGMISPS